MGKDPAFLFYPNDYLGGTMGFTCEMHGAYILMLILQFNNGPFTESSTSIIGDLWPKIIHKFKKNSSGLFFNERLQDEIEKREQYSASRRKNIGSRWNKNEKPLSNKKIDSIHMNNICNTHVIHMENRNRNENEDRIKNEKGIKNEKRKFIPPVFEEFESFCIDNGFREIARRSYDGYVAADWHDSQGKKIKNWKQKLLHVWFREENKNKPIRKQYGRQDFTHEMFADQMAFLKDDPRP